MSKNKKHENDKFYTKKNVVKKLISNLKLGVYDIIIEPSAGDGSFIDYIEDYNYIAIDIQPENNRIIKMDWFDFKLDKNYNKILVLGNPPFGNQGSLAMNFIKKCSDLKAYHIAFILPKSFKKESVKNRIPSNYHMILEINIPDESFTLNNIDYSVPCIFQIWERRDIIREKIKLPTKTKYFDFVKKQDKPDISFRRVGFYAGHIYDNTSDKSDQSHYFIKSNGYMSLIDIKSILKSIKWEHDNTSGPRSIGKGELIIEFEKKVIN